MSSRVLRKLEADQHQANKEEEDDEDEDSMAANRGAKPRRPNLNPFELVR